MWIGRKAVLWQAASAEQQRVASAERLWQEWNGWQPLPNGEIAAVVDRLQDGRGVGRVLRVLQVDGNWRETTAADQAHCTAAGAEELAAAWAEFDAYHAARGRLYREWADHCVGDGAT